MLMSRLNMASMTFAWCSVQINSFLNPRVCQEFVLSTTQCAPACKGSPRVLMTQLQPGSVSRLRVLALS